MLVGERNFTEGLSGALSKRHEYLRYPNCKRTELWKANFHPRGKPFWRKNSQVSKQRKRTPFFLFLFYCGYIIQWSHDKIGMEQGYV